ncbi:MAG TPA: hypothetical protein PKZ76_00205 [Xanthomonadaceae bacterium]|nr:hypothetical protein [Xanthomonadaceae bacterium]
MVECAYTCLWEYEVSEEWVEVFERQYGPAGEWARLFRLSPDYIETLLLKDRAVSGRYLTVDRWRSEEAYRAFKSAYAVQYAKLDSECERLTSAERSLGAFSELSSGHSFRPNHLRGSA